MELYIVRHGETSLNKREILQGHFDINLNRNGLKQAKLVAKRLSKIKFDYIYSSDLLRAKKTTQEIIKFQNCPVEYSERIRERNLGIFQGRPRTHYLEYLKEKNLIGNFKHRLPEGESYNQFRKRVASFIEKIYRKHKNQTILISTHGGVKRVLLNYLDERPLDHPRKFNNVSLSIIQFKKKKHKIILENCVQHLK